MSIRLRLTLFYSTILALTLVAFSTTLYVTQTQSTYRSIEANLVRQAGFFTNSSDHAPKPPADGDAGAFTPDRAPAPGADLPSGALPGRWTPTRSITGTITGLTFDLSGVSLPLSDEGLANVQAGVGWFETAQVQDEPLLIYSTLVITREGAPLIVQVAYPVGQPQQTPQHPAPDLDRGQQPGDSAGVRCGLDAGGRGPAADPAPDSHRTGDWRGAQFPAPGRIPRPGR